jgi:hypothetical protein
MGGGVTRALYGVHFDTLRCIHLNFPVPRRVLLAAFPVCEPVKTIHAIVGSPCLQTRSLQRVSTFPTLQVLVTRWRRQIDSWTLATTG